MSVRLQRTATAAGTSVLAGVLRLMDGVRRGAPMAKPAPPARESDVRRAMAAAALGHPRVAAVRTRVRRGAGRYEVHLTVDVRSVSGWRAVASDLRAHLREVLADRFGARGEVYVTVHHVPAPPPVPHTFVQWVHQPGAGGERHTRPAESPAPPDAWEVGGERPPPAGIAGGDTECSG